MKFRKKPVVIEAVQWNGDREIVDNFMGLTDSPDTANHAYSEDTVIIKTLEGNVVASKGDWIIKGVANEYYPCKPDIFEQTYEVVQE